VTAGAGIQFSKLQPLRCARCLAKGHNCYTDRLDDNKQPICVFCEDGEPCFWEQRNKKSPPPPAIVSAPKPQLITRKEAPMQTQPAPAPTPKTNGHTPALAQRLCKCGCGESVPPFQRFAYIAGHMKRGGKKAATKAATREKCACGRPLGHTGRHIGGQRAASVNSPSAAPPVAARVSLAVTEAQLNLFLVRLSLDEKQRLANYFLETAEG
jgi:hypothetical protein